MKNMDYYFDILKRSFKVHCSFSSHPLDILKVSDDCLLQQHINAITLKCAMKMIALENPKCGKFWYENEFRIVKSYKLGLIHDCWERLTYPILPLKQCILKILNHLIITLKIHILVFRRIFSSSQYDSFDSTLLF
jgi:hypothetical protein